MEDWYTHVTLPLNWGIHLSPSGCTSDEILTPMLNADLGKHDVILGKKWIAENQVLPDCASNRLLWPDELPPWKEAANQLVWTLLKTILRQQG